MPAGEVASKAQSSVRDREKAAEAKLRAAGVSQEGINHVLSSPELIDSVLNDGASTIPLLLSAFPSASASQYDQIGTEFGLGTPSAMLGSGGPEGAMAATLAAQEPYQLSSSGAREYDNGVRVVPNAGLEGVFYPPNNDSIRGSEAWLLKVQDTWSKAKVSSWRKKLSKMGYEVSANGDGWDWDLRTATDEYYRRFYINGRKPMPLAQNGGVDRKDFDGLLNPAILRDKVEGWFSDIGIDAPHPDDVQYISEKFAHEAMQIARKKGISPGNAAQVAEAKAFDKFQERPDVHARQESMDEYKMKTGLWDTYLSTAQIVAGTV